MDSESVPHGSSLSIHQSSIENMFKDELFSRVRARRDSDDVGLPHSPCTSPTTVDVLSQGFKEKSFKCRTTSSAGSLISVESSENDESSSGHSSRMSLIDRRSLDSDGDMELSVPLNHNAAHHKIAIKPKRTHGLPRRRVNQIAATKINTLPSTPEVAEDNGKIIQALETIEVMQNIQESTICLESESISMKMSERKVMHTSYSCNEMSDFTEELIQDKTSSEGNVNQTLKNRDFLFEESFKKTDIIKPNQCSDVPSSKDSFKPEIKEDPFSSTSSKHFIERNKEFVFCEAKHEECSDFRKETSKTIFPKNEMNNKIKLSDPFQNKMDEPIQVLSLVKSIEKTDSFKSSDKSLKSSDFDRKTNDCERVSHTKKDELCMGADKVKSSNSFNSAEIISHSELEDQFTTSVAKDTNKLNIDCEFILKPLKKDTSLSNDFDVVAKDAPINEGSIISSIFFDEDIMSEKALLMDVEEGGISVSHHTSNQNDLKNILVTEAHNYAAAEEKSDVLMTTENLHDFEQESSEMWISAVGIKNPLSDNSMPNVCKGQISEERITISVNSKQALKYMHPSKEENLNHEVTASIKSDISHKVSGKEKHSTKSNLFDCKEVSSNIKNINSQKRVSVEIVPFSQRMKERKYQPITFASKDMNADKEKKIPNASIERKLSDRKTTSKTKETEKPNGRHSFSGVISSDRKDIVTDKKPLKTDKLQYPVQIRIHKSIPPVEGKDTTIKPASNKDRKNSFTKNIVKDEKNSAQKLVGKDVKSDKEKSIAENTKWEVKIQSAPIQPVAQLTEDITRVDPQLSPKSENYEIESVGHEKNGKAQGIKEVFSDDPEPELLRVFARRSIKQKHCDKMKDDEKPVLSEDSLRTDDVISVSHNSTVIKISETKHVKHDLKKKSKSFSEKERTRSVSPLKEINLIHRESPTKLDTLVSNEHPRQRMVPDMPVTLPPGVTKYHELKEDCREELKGPIIGTVKEDVLNGKDAPSWLQLAQQRREMREQRERLLLGGSPNSFMDASNKPSRSSKVWDMVNNFQKLQMT